MALDFLKNIFSNNNNVIQPPIQQTPAQPAPSADEPGLLIVDDVFSITGRGVVATGRVESGTFVVNQPITIKTANGPIQSIIIGIESFRKTHDHATAGDNVGLLLKDVNRKSISRGDQICAN